MLLLLCSDTPVDHLSNTATFLFIIQVALPVSDSLKHKEQLCKAEQAEAAKIVPPGQDFLQKVQVGHLQMLFIRKVSVETAVTAAATM